VRYFWESISSWAYWRYVVFSAAGFQSVLTIFGAIYLVVEALDFFKVYSRDEYASFAFLVFLLIAAALSIVSRRPISCTVVKFAQRDFEIEVRIGNLFDAAGAILVSTNTVFECDVASGKISSQSLQGQFTAKYFTGNQNLLIEEVKKGLDGLDGPPYPMGTTIPVNTHGKTFYFTAIATLNAEGNASTTIPDVKKALNGLWDHVRRAGELQELAVPLIGTGRGRLQVPRNKMIELISESFVEASANGKFTDRLVIVIHPDDAKRFQVNLYEVKDRLRQALIV
jgi:hypothetical protein